MRKNLIPFQQISCNHFIMNGSVAVVENPHFAVLFILNTIRNH